MKGTLRFLRPTPAMFCSSMYLSFNNLYPKDHEALTESVSGLIKWHYANCCSFQSSFDSN